MPSTEKTLLWLQAFRHRPDVAPFFLVLYGEGFHIWIASEFLEEVSADARCWAPWSDTDLVGRSEVGFRLSFQHASPAFSYAVMCGNVSTESDTSALLLWLNYFCVWSSKVECGGERERNCTSSCTLSSHYPGSRTLSQPVEQNWKSTRLDSYRIFQL